MAGGSFKLPFLAGHRKLPELPGQRQGVEYGIIWDACPIPARGSCYIVRFERDAQVSIVGYVDDNGGAYHADRPLTLPPAGEPDLAVVPDENGHEGTVYTKDGHAALQPVTRYHGAFRGLMREVSEDETWNSTRSLAYRPFMASLYLRLCVIDGADAPRAASSAPDMTPVALEQPVDLMADFMHAALPDAIETLLYRIERKDDPSGIERFAVRLFGDLDQARLRAICASRPPTLAFIEHMDGLYLAFDQAGRSRDDVLFLLDVEARINRLHGVLVELGFGMRPVTSSPSEEACSVMDQKRLRDVTGRVRELVDRAVQPNIWAKPAGVAARPGGEWDVRTRFAQACERLNMTVRLSYVVQCSVDEGVISVRFVMPDATALPRAFYDQAAGAWRVVDEARRKRAAQELSARMALVLAAAAFSAGFSIDTCTVGGRAAADEAPQAVVRFERAAFMAQVLPLAERLQGVSLATHEAADALRPLLHNDEPAAAAQRALYITPGEDKRRLPEALSTLLLADTVDELEVMEDPGDKDMARVMDLRALAVTEPARAYEELAAMVGELEARTAAVELMSDVPLVSQFCESYVGRVLVPLAVGDASARINRVPDALFFAQHELASMFMQAGEYERALPEARKVLDMATTSMQAHFLLVNVLARLGRHEEVVEVVKHGLRFACDREAAAYLLYRGAFSLWHTGEREAALTCYSMIPPGDQLYQLARREMRAFMAEAGITEPVGVEEGYAALERVGLVVPPAHEVVERLVDVAILLTDGGFYHLASRCTLGLCHVVGHDELGVTGRSLTPWRP